MADDSSPYGLKKEREAARQREQSAKDREIGPLPEVKNPARRKKALGNFQFYCEQYFPKRFNLKWSRDHKKVIREIQRIVTKGGLLAVAMPRGSGKTSLAEVAVLWAIKRGEHQFVALIGANQEKAGELLLSIRTELESNELLAEDFPEICVPIAKLQGVQQRRMLLDGKPVRLKFGSRHIELPDIEGSSSCSAIIKCVGLTGGGIRGMSYTRPDGTRVRPRLVILDDPQTDQSAASLKQNATRERLLAGAVLGLAGPGQKISGIMPCTVIKPGDMIDRILDREKHAEWNGIRTQLLDAFPKIMRLWREYWEVRSEGLRQGDDGAAGNTFYVARRREMDEGAKVSWPERFNPDEISAIQNAMNLFLQDKQAFFAEYQNDPASGEDDADTKLTADMVTRRMNGLVRCAIPLSAEYLAAGIDVHKELLYCTVAAAETRPTIAIPYYSTWPEQRRSYFRKDDVTQTISRMYKSLGHPKAQLAAALEALIIDLVSREWKRPDGHPLRIGKIVIDANYDTDTVFEVCMKSKHRDILLPSFGTTPSRYAGRKKIKGQKVGEDYVIPPRGDRPCRYALIHSSAWISRTVAGFQVPQGAVGAWTLYGDGDREQHRLYAEHITAEYSTTLIDKATRRTITTWTPKPDHPDNHWLDATKLAVVGCFELGCQSAFIETPASSGKKPQGQPRWAEI